MVDDAALLGACSLSLFFTRVISGRYSQGDCG